MSDSFNLCGALEFSEKISKAGTQNIIGNQISFKYKDEMIRKTIELTQKDVEAIKSDVESMKITLEKLDERLYDLAR